MARILVIDDSATIVKHLTILFEARGHQVTSLSTMLELVPVIKKDPPDVIILDLKIPGLSGRATGKLIRKYQEREIPIIIHSSQPPEELISAADELKAATYLAKGCDREELIRAVERACRRSVGHKALLDRLKKISETSPPIRTETPRVIGA